ncbi:hypothetical protein [Chromobacterium alticapitis]|uniref:hypothetical protein n=1 Tax=Chromobacterium alticapitis TaxID=2073169 RepID=UPI0018EB76DD|nr:hypothetical protein [Chromobacterium alticapitis]
MAGRRLCRILNIHPMEAFVRLMNIPAEAEQALAAIRHRLADSLAAVYLHGSAVAGGR